MNYKKMYPRYLWMIPLVIYTLFYILPGILGIYYSFVNYTIYNDSKEFVGFANYIQMFSQNRFRVGLGNTLLFAVLTTVCKNLIGLAMAVALNTSIRSRNVLRTIFYLPVILSTLIVGQIFQAMLQPDTGLINHILSVFSSSALSFDWLGNPNTAMWMVILVEIWIGAGYCMVIYLAGLQVISKEYYEAASIDGATAWTSFKNITLPLIVPSISINVLLSVVNGLKVFDIIIALTGGGPGMSTQVLSTTIYSYLGSGALSTGCAANVVLTVFVIVVFFALNKLFAKLEVDH